VISAEAAAEMPNQQASGRSHRLCILRESVREVGRRNITWKCEFWIFCQKKWPNRRGIRDQSERGPRDRKVGLVNKCRPERGSVSDRRR
jgi:hypothetical protein